MKAKTGVSISEVETIKAKGPKLPAFEEGFVCLVLNDASTLVGH